MMDDTNSNAAVNAAPESDPTGSQEASAAPAVATPAVSARKGADWVIGILLILVLAVGAYLRLSGINWDDDSYNHPDERFLIDTTVNLQPVKSLGDYFNTAQSTLNPNNRSAPWYVYGTFPLMLVRYVGEWIKQVDWHGIKIIGRSLSALLDLGTVLLVFLIGTFLYNRRTGLLAAAFSAFAVLQIQQSHFYTVDLYANFFITLAIFFAAWLLARTRRGLEPAGAAGGAFSTAQVRSFFSGPWLWLSLLFGAALGLAMASKVNSLPVAFMLPLAVVIYMARYPFSEWQQRGARPLLYLILAGAASLIVFRCVQPYSFSGPAFYNISINPKWLKNLQDLVAFSSRDVDYYPPAYQWARRPIWFSFENLVQWGFGTPLGLLSWAGFLFAAWRMIKGEWREHLLLWAWTAVYFTWQSLPFNPSMRYQLPVYPILAIFAGWLVIRLWDEASARRWKWLRAAVGLIGAGVLVAAGLYAFAFVQIYQRPLTRVEASRWIFQNLPGPVTLQIQPAGAASGAGSLTNQPLSIPYDNLIYADNPYQQVFVAKTAGNLISLHLPHVITRQVSNEARTLTLTIESIPPGSRAQASVELSPDVFNDQGLPGQDLTLTLDQPLPLAKEAQYNLTVQLSNGAGMISLLGTALANEGAWDDGLPYRIDGYDAFGGMYTGGLNFDMYDDDDNKKLARFENILNEAEYIAISSNRQYGTLTRLPERFPLSTTYYRSLLGCPADKNLIACYYTAQPGMYTGSLGFTLVKVVQSDPSIGPFRINDQFAEEAFTVYDHPKVLIFKKTSAYSPEKAAAILEGVDLSKVIKIPPGKAGSFPSDLMLPISRWVGQVQGGTWASLFNPDALINRFPGLAAVVYYLALFLLGLAAYPWVRLALPGLADRGYPLARLSGVLLFSYLAWLGGSYGISVTRGMLSLVMLGVVVIGGGFAWRQWPDLKQEWRSQRRLFLIVEGVALAAFLIELGIRLGNPDLWHPSYGGEKPMDFSYFNAVLKSTTFPPYDPWFAGGYLNYYYYGFVLAGMLVKWIGITPSVAYNLVLPGFFMMVALGAFSIGWNLFSRVQTGEEDGPRFRLDRPVWIGLASLFGTLILGNLGTVRMIWYGWQKLVAQPDLFDKANVLTRWLWAAQGFVKWLGGAALPYSTGQWYWIPSRAIIPEAGNEITEFPFFTFLYADPHAHLFALPVALLAIAWALSAFLARGRWGEADQKYSWLSRVCSFALAGLTVGALYPANTWDFPTYLVLCVAALAAAVWPSTAGPFHRRAAILAGYLAALIGISLLLYRPFFQWWGQAYNSVELWKGHHTAIWSYLVHWGLFLFLIISWMTAETIDWMARTPLSSLKRIAPYLAWLQAGIVLAGAVIVGLVFIGVEIGWFVLPLAIWAAVLLFKPQNSDAKRAVLFLVGTALTLTLVVEVVVLKGDIGRQNTVFKLYVQAWLMFAVSAAAAMGWTWALMPRWSARLQLGWTAGLVGLVAGAALVPMMAGSAKIQDRMAPQAPHTLDGMAYMAFSQYGDAAQGGEYTQMDISQDYLAIRWMQQHVKGSPVIVEAHTVEYRWGNRFTIYTGLPGVVGWSWHQRQQRALIVPESWITDRIAEIENFYITPDPQEALAFLRKYNVRYVIVGLQEHLYYSGPGLEKFAAMNGAGLQRVYQAQDTAIYEVTP